MANNFSKEELVMFDDVLAGFDDMLVISKGATTTVLGDPQTMMRSSDRIWRPMPYIATSVNGIDQTGNFGDIINLSVPCNLGLHKAIPKSISAKDLRDPSEMTKFGKAAKQKLASDINLSVYQAVALQGSVWSKRTGAASGYDDVAEIDALYTEIGLGKATERLAFYGARDYNKMAGNLASRTLDNSKSLNAYEKAYVGEVAGIDTYKNDLIYSLAAATGTTVAITNTQPLYYTPVGSTVDSLNNTTNVDNRFQTISITVGGSTVKVGDAFTIAGVNSVHAITKQSTGQLKTFRITEIVTGAGGSGTVKITPPIISGGGGTMAELMYQNVAATPANGALLTFLNTVTANVNPHFIKEAVEIIPGSYSVEPGDGWSVLRGTSELGIPITFIRQADINTLNVKYRWDIDWGVVITNTEMAGGQQFSQT